MANLTQEVIDQIQALKKEGLSKLAISKQLNLSRLTVAKYWGDDATFAATESIPEYEELSGAVVAKKPDVGKISTMGGLLARRFLFNPKRVAAILQRFYKAAQEDNRVLLKYLDIILPPGPQSGGVMVNVQTNVKIDPTKKYDLEGNEIVVEKS